MIVGGCRCDLTRDCILPSYAIPGRETRNKLHQLYDILMMVLCAVLSGVEDWVRMETFAE